LHFRIIANVWAGFEDEDVRFGELVGEARGEEAGGGAGTDENEVVGSGLLAGHFGRKWSMVDVVK
jgi:hypothetical protein